MAEKVTVMVLEVDLQCPSCYKKVKKILSKFPQIRDETYNEKANTVTVSVLCCAPEKIREKLCGKGSQVIKSIEIKEPTKPTKPQKIQKQTKEEKIEDDLGKPNKPDDPTVGSQKPHIAGVPLRPWHDGCYGWGYYPQPCYCGGCRYGYWHAQRCGYYCYCTEENPQYCSIM